MEKVALKEALKLVAKCVSDEEFAKRLALEEEEVKMPKTIKNFGVAVLRDVKRSDGTEYEPSNWRLEYINRQGILELRESVRKNPGGHFLYFEGADIFDDIADSLDWELRTWYGTETIEGNVLTFRTSNSLYTFEIAEEN